MTMGMRACAWAGAMVLVLTACTGSGDAGDAPVSATTVTAEVSTPSSEAIDAPAPTDAPVTTAQATTTTAPIDGYRAEIRRTTHGVAHIVADDLASLGFGQGYAFAQDRACTLIDQVVKVRGERSRWHGPGDGEANINSDLAYRHLRMYELADARWANQPAEIAEMIEGYVVGFNAAVEADGPGYWCAGEPWVQPITVTDLYATISDTLGLASTGALLTRIPTAAPPAVEGDAPATTESAAAPWETAGAPLASNGWALGDANSDSDSGGGIVVANPHFPWEGERRFWELHLTVPGDLDVYGVSLGGLPGVQIGFNDAVAWTHTVSAGKRFTLYELSLVPGSPTTYLHGDEQREMTASDITVEVLQPDGSLASTSRTLYASHYGPMLDLPLGWSTEKAYTMRDANGEIDRVLRQFLGMDRARSMDEFQQVHEKVTGIPWVNTIAASADGRAWYADTATTPHLSDESIAEWRAAVDAGGTAALVKSQGGAIMLDGSNPANEWVIDPEAPAPGLLPYRLMPQTERRDFVFNANDSHWVAAADDPLLGFSPATGDEETVLTARSRMNLRLLLDAAAAGADAKFSLDEIKGQVLSNRALSAEDLRAAVVEECTGVATVDVDGTAVEIGPACAALAAWDGRYDADSVGPIVWREFWYRFTRDDWHGVTTALWEVPFDPADPATTPNTPAADRSGWLPALGRAVFLLNGAGIPVDAPLGEFQRDGRVADGVGLHGGEGDEGIANVISCCARGGSSTAPGAMHPLYTDEAEFSTDPLGYPVSYGTSFLMAVQFTDDGPVADAFLIYGQPDDPADPDFTAQAEAFAAKDWRRIVFAEADVLADPAFTTTTVTAPR